MTRANPHPRAPRAARSAGGWRLPVDLAPALSTLGLVAVGVVTLALFGGSLPLPGGPGGPFRTATPSNIVVVPNDPRADVSGAMLYVKNGNLWLQSGSTARQLTSSGQDSMPAWSPDGESVYFVRTVPEEGRWPSGGQTRTYTLQVPTLHRMRADGTGIEDLLTGRLTRGGNSWSYFIREPAVAPDGTQIAIVTDGPDPTQSDIVVKLLNLESLELENPRLGQTQALGHQDPAWSPDGRFLMYVRNAREGTRGVPAIVRYNPANGRSVEITGGGYADPSWSRDGRYLVATKTTSFGTNVVILDARSGVELVRVTRDETSFNPVWSPKGDAIAFFRVTHGVVDLYLVPLTGTGPAWTVGEPLAVTVAAGLDAASRPTWFIPPGQLPPLPTPTAVPSSPDGPAATTAP